MHFSIQATRDGSHTICNLDFNKTYHSIHGAVGESRHIFIQAGLEPVLTRHKRIQILEVGFGTGLNALLTLHHVLEENTAGRSCEVFYTTLEPYPLSVEMAQELNHAQYFSDSTQFAQYLSRLHEVAWEEWQPISEGFHLKKKRTTLADFQHERDCYNLIYFHPFPPSAQPYLWEPLALHKIAEAMAPEGVFITYSARGQLRRDLKALGLRVEKPPGPPGKREMTRATKL